MRLNSIRFWIVLLGICGATSPSVSASAEHHGPLNLVFLMTDDQCFDSLACYGNTSVKTRHLDELAKQGLVFDRHYTPTAICMASRATVMTGLLEYEHGCNFGRGPLLKKHWERSWPILLKSAGYRIGFAGKFGFEVAATPRQRGVLPESDFDAWGGGPGQTFYETARNDSMKRFARDYPHATRAYGAFGVEFIRKFPSDKRPFCLAISFKAPHRPVQPDPIDDAIYQRTAFSRPQNFGRENGVHLAAQSRLGRQYERFVSWGYRDQYQEVMRKYHQQIYAVDAAVGMIRNALRQSGLQENTVVIFTSDNGFLCGAHGYGSKVLPYEEASRVPLIIYDPTIPTRRAGGRTQALTGHHDFARTILDYAGIESDRVRGQGISLREIVQNPEKPGHATVPLINVWGPPEVHSLAIVSGEWKLIYWPWSTARIQPTTELFHLSQDRFELENRIADDKAAAAREKLADAYRTEVTRWLNGGATHHGYPALGHKFRIGQSAENSKRSR